MNVVSAIRAVVDTNLFVSALLSPLGNPARLVARWLIGDFLMLTSPALLDEVTEVARRPQLRRRMRFDGREADAMLAALITGAESVIPVPLDALPIVSRDPKDDPLLACALGGGAHFLVTGDDDLLELDGDERLGRLRILRVRDFLDRLPPAKNQSL